MGQMRRGDQIPIDCIRIHILRMVPRFLAYMASLLSNIHCTVKIFLHQPILVCGPYFCLRSFCKCLIAPSEVVTFALCSSSHGEASITLTRIAAYVIEEEDSDSTRKVLFLFSRHYRRQ